MADEGKTDSGASLTYPIRAGEVKKGGHVCIKGKPCKVIEITTSKTGKHGHAKANITALDIFTGNKLVDICPTSHNMEAPFVTRTEYMLTDVGEEGYLSLMDDEGNMKEDLKMPEGQLGEDIMKAFKAAEEDGSEVTCAVVSAMGQEAVLAYNTRTA
uniref:Eukaryotic translation initiation factor 5A n=1 Tax=Bicosoecida sp. CB-2014 TaxID=1486930 RepID=A0A7S1GB90_9STRA